MKSFDCDLHLHGLYSGGVSNQMTIPTLAEQARLKGLHVLATADALCKEWLEHLKRTLVEEDGTYYDASGKTAFIIGGEVQDAHRVHHVYFLPSIEAAEELREKLIKHGMLDGKGNGRPVLSLNAETLSEYIFDVGGILGPAHAFTPYFSVYAHFDSLQACYGTTAQKISFIELGLSADSYFADLIADNHNYVFLTCSDAHSPWPHRIGREFTRIRMHKPCFSELRKALEIRGQSRVELNVGLDPREGKYHCTACNRCYERFLPEDAARLRWRCPMCGGTIKKGVRHRILELASFSKEVHPAHRARYQHIIPLAEIIKLTHNIQNINSKEVQAKWFEFIDKFGAEIRVLIDEPIDELAKIDERVAESIHAFRQGFVLYISGGGGRYGEPIICSSAQELERKRAELREKLECNADFRGQRTLGEFS
jgi:uncharacterized protein (TIGR00375 family)